MARLTLAMRLVDTTKAEVTVNARAFPTIDELAEVLLEHAYVTDRVLATVLYLTLKLRKPLLLEGEAGVGKTQVAKTLAEVLQNPPDPPPMLRGTGRQQHHLRVEL